MLASLYFWRPIMKIILVLILSSCSKRIRIFKVFWNEFTRFCQNSVKLVQFNTILAKSSKFILKDLWFLNILISFTRFCQNSVELDLLLLEILDVLEILEILEILELLEIFETFLKLFWNFWNFLKFSKFLKFLEFMEVWNFWNFLNFLSF